MVFKIRGFFAKLDFICRSEQFGKSGFVVGFGGGGDGLTAVAVIYLWY